MMPWPTIYLICTLAVLALAWVAREPVRQRLALIMVLSWIQQNVWTVQFGFADAPIWVAASDLVLMGITAWVGHCAKSWAAFALVVLFGLRGAVHFAGHLGGWQGDYLYYASLNVLFIAQLIVVGFTSGHELQRTGLGSFDGGPRHKLVAGSMAKRQD